MRSLLLLVAILTPCVAFGATIVPNTNLTLTPISEPDPFDEFGTNYVMRIEQDVFGDFTEISFAFKQTSATGYSLDVTWVNLDQSADLYLVEPGDSFSKEGIAGNEFIPLFIADLFKSSVTVSSDFYLGVNTGKMAGDRRDAFGWVHFKVLAMPLPFPAFDDDVLIMVENAMSYDSPGIIVGTHTVVPEPSTIALTSIAFVTLVTLRRRN